MIFPFSFHKPFCYDARQILCLRRTERTTIPQQRQIQRYGSQNRIAERYDERQTRRTQRIHRKRSGNRDSGGGKRLCE